MSITIKDFQPINRWDVDYMGEAYLGGNPKFVIDRSTGKKYLNESKSVIKFKCILLAIGTPFVHIPCAIGNMAYRVAIVSSGYRFWSEEGRNQCFSTNCLETSIDGLRVITQPVSFIGLEAASIYGLIKPRDGRKLYASIEKAQYGSDILAPCFQPRSQQHLFGGDINSRNTF